MKIKVLGVDPSMSNWGMSVAEIDLVNSSVKVEELRLVQTKPDKNKRIRKNSDDLRLAGEIHQAFSELLKGVRLVFVEVPHGSQSARAMASYGMCVGLLAACQEPMFELSEQQLKLELLNSKSATKAQMIEEVVRRHPEADWPKKKDGSIIASKAEHLADATAAIHAGMKTDEFRRLVSWWSAA